MSVEFNIQAVVVVVVFLVNCSKKEAPVRTVVTIDMFVVTAPMAMEMVVMVVMVATREKLVVMVVAMVLMVVAMVVMVAREKVVVN